jgi:hypothetical protein
MMGLKGIEMDASEFIQKHQIKRTLSGSRMRCEITFCVEVSEKQIMEDPHMGFFEMTQRMIEQAAARFNQMQDDINAIGS